MKLYTGIDMERVDRFEHLVNKESFFQRVYTEKEREHIALRSHRPETAAGIFCAKEAIAKAVGKGLFGLNPIELGLDWDENGAPFVCLTGSAARQYGHLQFSVSITHTKEMAAAMCTALDPEV